MKHHVLIVDDDEMIRDMVAFLVQNESNIKSTGVATGKDMHSILQNDAVSLIVLDMGLPDEDGLVLARQIRARSMVPIIVLTGDQSNETLITALEIGVNDFVHKPFDPYELQLRIKNQLQFFRPEKNSPLRRKTKRIKFGDYTLDPRSRSLTNIAGKEVPLTPTEFEILLALLRQPNTAFSRNMILDVISKGEQTPSDRAVDVFIAQLRRKIEVDPKKPQMIKSVRGFGYKFTIEL